MKPIASIIPLGLYAAILAGEDFASPSWHFSDATQTVTYNGVPIAHRVGMVWRLNLQGKSDKIQRSRINQLAIEFFHPGVHYARGVVYSGIRRLDDLNAWF
jgi:hypothetical protein